MRKFEGGLESTEIVEQVDDNTHSNIEDFVVETLSEIDHNDVTTDDTTDEAPASNQDIIRKRRVLLDGKLTTYKHERMK